MYLSLKIYKKPNVELNTKVTIILAFRLLIFLNVVVS